MLRLPSEPSYLEHRYHGAFCRREGCHRSLSVSPDHIHHGSPDYRSSAGLLAVDSVCPTVPHHGRSIEEQDETKYVLIRRFPTYCRALAGMAAATYETCDSCWVWSLSDGPEYFNGHQCEDAMDTISRALHDIDSYGESLSPAVNCVRWPCPPPSQSARPSPPALHSPSATPACRSLPKCCLVTLIVAS